EVLAVGDESFQKKCVAWIERFLGQGGTLILCSHSMFHIQTLCAKALWIHHGRIRLRGDSFDVTREYLTYHEEKNSAAVQTPRVAEGPIPRIVATWTECEDGTPASIFRQGQTLVIQGVAYEPDDRPPVLLFGVARVDGTPIYGSHSNETDYRPSRLERCRFGFAVRFEALALLPGKYRLRVHVLDAEGLRLFDTIAMEFVVTGETRDYGLVTLPHRWSAGRSAPRPEDDCNTR
ncbi:MAG TPA: hypothetical protein VN878_05980, partial [Usitatibacter sp.]|nr:hypothetical protein [Usitatibacter sp.]